MINSSVQNNRLLGYFIKPKFFNILLIFLFSFQVKEMISKYFDSFYSDILNNTSSLIDVADYYNLYLIVTIDNKIYTGIPPELKVDNISDLKSISSAVTYDENNILISCTEKYLLTNINLETGEETPLIYYEDISVPNPENICSLSYMDNYAYIGINHIIVPEEEENFTLIEEENFTLNEEGNFIFDEEENFIFDEEENFIFDEEENFIFNEEGNFTLNEKENFNFNEEKDYTFNEEEDIYSNNFTLGDEINNTQSENEERKVYLENIAIRVKLKSINNKTVISNESENINII